MSRGRKPRSDELDLWRKVATSAEPLRKPAQSEASMPKTLDSDISFHDAVIEGLPKRIAGTNKTKPNDLAPSLPDQIARSPVQMDKKTFGRMNKGRLQPEARLDLHGMTLDRAHPALVRFVLSNHASGKRLVLVITGKGKSRDDGGPIPVRFGVLRHQVPQWLAMPPLSGAVLQITQAHQKHGGSGAYYVYLRRQR